MSDAEAASKILRQLARYRSRTPVLTVSGLVKRLLPELSALLDDGYSHGCVVDTLLNAVSRPPCVDRLSQYIVGAGVEQQCDPEALDRQLLEETPVYSVADAEKISKKLRQLAPSRWLTPVLTISGIVRRLNPELLALFGAAPATTTSITPC